MPADNHLAGQWPVVLLSEAHPEGHKYLLSRANKPIQNLYRDHLYERACAATAAQYKFTEDPDASRRANDERRLELKSQCREALAEKANEMAAGVFDWRGDVFARSLVSVNGSLYLFGLLLRKHQPDLDEDTIEELYFENLETVSRTIADILDNSPNFPVGSRKTPKASSPSAASTPSSSTSRST